MKQFTLLEKEALYLSTQESEYTAISIPNIQSCECLILWHKNKLAVMHANGFGNEVAMCETLLNKFNKEEIHELQVHLIGGIFEKERQNFFSEFTMWFLGANSNAIAHPLISVLNRYGIKKENIHTNLNQAEDNAHVMLNISNGHITVTRTQHETSYHGMIQKEITRRGADIKQMTNRLMSKHFAYTFFSNQKSCINAKPKDGPTNNYFQKYEAWFPKLQS